MICRFVQNTETVNLLGLKIDENLTNICVSAKGKLNALQGSRKYLSLNPRATNNLIALKLLWPMSILAPYSKLKTISRVKSWTNVKDELLFFQNIETGLKYRI